MLTTVSIQVPGHLLTELIQHLQRNGDAQDMSQAVVTAIEHWLSAQKHQPQPPDAPGLRGYQWKSLFLPEGSCLRSWSYGEHNYACVVGDQIIHDGRPVTPNQFARSFARSHRNAWLDLSIRLPGEKIWKKASLLRRELASVNAQAICPAADPAPCALPQSDADAGAPSPPSRPATAATRQVTPSCDWSLPERRKFRFRLEDAAFD